MMYKNTAHSSLIHFVSVLVSINFLLGKGAGGEADGQRALEDIVQNCARLLCGCDTGNVYLVITRSCIGTWSSRARISLFGLGEGKHVITMGISEQSSMEVG